MSTEMSQRIAALSPEQRERLIQRLQQESGSPVSAPLEGPRMPEAPLEPGAPIPLTDLQEVYWIGRSGLFDLGGCGANLYLEYELSGSVWSLGDNLSSALRRTIERHAILRTVVDADGALRLLPEVPPFEAEVADLSRLPDDQIAAHLERVRDEMRYARAPMDRWPLFRVVLHQIQEDRLRLHTRFDSTLFDGRSRGVLMREIVQLATEPDAELPPLDVSFLDHMRALAQHRAGAAWARARDYWMSLLPTLPPLLAPPLARAVSPDTVPRQVKRQIRMLEPEAWLQARRTASRTGISPTTLLATAFSEILRPWSATPAFTLGLVGSYKPRIHPQIDRVVGNFNTLQLLAVEAGTGSFADRARRLQQRIAADLDHQAFSGHRVLREWNRRRRTSGKAALPVLFDSFVEYGHAAYRTSGPGEAPRQDTAPAESPQQTDGLTEIDMTLSLPQILLMVVAIEEPDGGLTFISQGVEELLPPGAIPGLLERVQSLLARLAGGEAAWHEEPADLLPAPATVLPARGEPTRVPAAVATSPAAPWGPLENKLADLWEEVLGRRPTPGEDNDFFELGGDSLLVTRLLERVAGRFELDRPLAAFLERPTLAHLAELVDRRQTETAQRAERRSPLRRLRDSLAAFRARLLPPPTSPAYGMRTFLLLWFSQFVSGIGTGLGSFAFGIWVYRQHTSVTQYSLFMFVATCTGLLVAPLAGVLADRWDRKRLILLGDSGAAVMTSLMALALYTGQMRLWYVYIVVVFMVGFSALQGPAQVAVSSQLVSRRQLGRVSGMTQAAGIATGLICPPLSGALVPILGYHGVIAIDITTFLFAFVVLLLIRLPSSRAATASPERRSILGDFGFGWSYLRQRPGLLSLLWIFAATNFALSIVQVLLTPLVLSFGSATNLGFVNSAMAAGGLIGSLVLSIWGGPKNRMNGILLFLLLQAPILLLGALRPNVMLIAVACFIFTSLGPLVGGLSQAIWQTKVAHEIQGRVFAMRGLVVSSAAPLAYLLAGPLADRVFEPLMAPGGALAGTIGQLIGTGKGRGVGLLFMTLGLLIILVVSLSSLNPRLRKVESELPDAVLDSEPEDSPDKAQAEARPPVENDRLELEPGQR